MSVFCENHIEFTARDVACNTDEEGGVRIKERIS